MPLFRTTLRAIAAVLSGFIGIRKRRAATQDQQLSAAHIIIAGVLLLAALVGALLFVVKSVL